MQTKSFFIQDKALSWVQRIKFAKDIAAGMVRLIIIILISKYNYLVLCLLWSAGQEYGGVMHLAIVSKNVSLVKKKKKQKMFTTHYFIVLYNTIWFGLVIAFLL